MSSRSSARADFLVGLDLPIVLASASPRRAQILRALGLTFEVWVADVDESYEAAEAPTAVAERLARMKAAAGSAVAPHAVLIGADTVVVCDQRIFGKPSTPAEAASMLRMLAGRTHEVVTGVAVQQGGRVESGVESTSVRFSRLSDAQIGWYVATGEPMDKAGAYHIDGHGALFIESVSGSPSNVAGLPVALLRQLLERFSLNLNWPRE